MFRLPINKSLPFLIAILFILFGFSNSWSKARSGSYAHRAKIQWDEGNYTAAHALYRNALSESIREADIEVEALIKLNMASMELDAMRIDEAQKYIQSLPPFIKSLKVKYQTLIIQLQIGIAQRNCGEIPQKLLEFIEQHKENESISKAQSRIHMVHCYRIEGDFEAANKFLLLAREEYDGKAKGLRAWAKGLIHIKQNKWPEAIEELHKAFDYAQKANKAYQIGQILFYLGYSYEKVDKSKVSQRYAKEFYKRSYQVFDKIQLARPTMKSLKNYLRLSDDKNSPNYQTLSKSLSVLENQHKPEDLKSIYDE